VTIKDSRQDTFSNYLSITVYFFQLEPCVLLHESKGVATTTAPGVDPAPAIHSTVKQIQTVARELYINYAFLLMHLCT
jgi:hypothetical protein